MERAELEAWADGVLDAHRSAPPPAAPDAPVADHELPPALRLMRRVDPDWQIDRATFESLQRRAETHRRLANVESALVLAGGAILLGFLLLVSLGL